MPLRVLTVCPSNSVAYQRRFPPCRQFEIVDMKPTVRRSTGVISDLFARFEDLDRPDYHTSEAFRFVGAYVGHDV